MQIGLGFFCRFLVLEGGHNDGRVDLVGMGSGCGWSTLCEIPKYSIEILCWEKKSKHCAGHNGDHL